MIKGINTALVTPFRQGVVDVDALVRLTGRQVAAGVHGIVVCASTGEGALLSNAERCLILETVVRTCGGTRQVIAGCSAMSTWDALEQAKAAAALGASSFMITAPPFVQPGQDALLAHFATVADHSKIPVILHNVPSRTASDIASATVARLSSHENIVAIQESSGDITRAQQILSSTGGKLQVLSGVDSLTLSTLVAGGHGTVSTSANLIPEKWMNIWRQFRSGDTVTAASGQSALLGLHEALFMESNPGPVKAALQLLGLGGCELRMPLMTPSRSTWYRLAAELENLGMPVESGALV